MFKLLCNIRVLSSAQYFAYKVILNRVATKENPRGEEQH